MSTARELHIRVTVAAAVLLLSPVAQAQKGGTKPPAPTGLVATAGVNQVSLTWNASAGATYYRVKRAWSAGGGYTTITPRNIPTTTNWVDTGLTANVRVYYVVTAVNKAGESPISAEVNALPTGAPPVPTGLAAAGMPGKVSLTWSYSVGADSYVVKRSTSSGGPYSTLSTTVFTSLMDVDVVPGVTHYYVVSAVGPFGVSANSGQAGANPGAAPTGSVPAIVYGSNSTGYIAVMNDDDTGSNALLAVPAGGGKPTFSPDGNTILFNSRRIMGSRYVSGIYAADVTGANLRLISPFFNITNNTYDGGWSSIGPYTAAWSSTTAPDGREWIAYIGNYYQPEGYGSLGEDVYLVRPDGTGRIRLGDPMNASGITWSPDATRIAIGGFNVWIGGDWRHALSIYTLRHNTILDTLEIESRRDYLTSDLLGDPDAEITYPSWSVTGERIVFRGYSPTMVRSDIFTVDLTNPDAPVVRNITNTPDIDEGNPSWSPDGGQVFYNQGGSQAGVMRINVDGTGKIRINPDGTLPFRRRF